MTNSHLICSENVENDYIFPADVLSLHITDIGALDRNLFNREQLLAGAGAVLTKGAISLLTNSRTVYNT